jgi:hypothetical protein
MLTSGKALAEGGQELQTAWTGQSAAKLDGQGDLLRECQLTDVGFNALDSTLSLVLDLRSALGFPDCDLAVITFRRVRTFSWTGPGSAQDWQPWYVVDSAFTRKDYWADLELALLPSQNLAASARSIELTAGRSDLFDLAQPDLTGDSAEAIRLGFPDLETRLEPVEYYSL